MMEKEENEQENEQEIEKRLERELRLKVIKILERGSRYVQSLLPSFSIDLEKEYSGDPLVLTIKVHLRKSQENNKKEG
jgi:hypothetical protein